MEQFNLLSQQPHQEKKNIEVALDVSKIDNTVLKRLIGEINFDRENHINLYNRTHNRHNRGR